MTKLELKDLVYKVNGAAIEVHKTLGPGLLERIYHKCLAHELKCLGINFVSEQIIPVIYKGYLIETDLFCDLFIENKLIVELKSVEQILPIHEAQILTYMKIMQIPLGLVINFNSDNIYKNGQRTFVNEIYRNLPEK